MALKILKPVVFALTATLLTLNTLLPSPVAAQPEGDMFGPYKTATALAAEVVAENRCKAPLNARPTVVEEVYNLFFAYDVVLADYPGTTAMDEAALAAAKAALGKPCADEAGVEALSTDADILFGLAWVADVVAFHRCAGGPEVVREMNTIAHFTLEAASELYMEADLAGVPPKAGASADLAVAAQYKMAEPCSAP